MRGRERAEFFLRENPVPTILGALAVGLAIGFAIRYASNGDEDETKSRVARINWSMFSLPFFWPMVKTAREKYGESADAVRDQVHRLKKIEIGDYIKPIRKRWKW